MFVGCISYIATPSKIKRTTMCGRESVAKSERPDMAQRDTRNRIHLGFLKVIAKQSYTDLSMKDLANELGMSRQNLYRYYSSKDQILADILEETLDPLLVYAAEVELDTTPDQQWATLMDKTFAFAYKNRDVLVAVFNSGMNDMIYEIMKSTTVRALGNMIRKNGLIIRDRAYFDIISHYITGGFFHIIKSWIESGMSIPPEKVATVLKTYSWKMLEDLVLSCD